MKKYFKGIVAAVITVSVIMSSAVMTMAGEKRTITTTGEGIVSVEPDVCNISLRVSSVENTAGKAKSVNDGKINAVVNALKARGLSEEDIISESFSLYPRYNWDNGYEEIYGYEAYQYLNVKVKNLDKVGEISDAVIDAGATVDGLSYSLLEKELAYVEALSLAVVNAKIKAEGIAKALGVKVLGPISVTEGTSNNSFAVYKGFAVEEAAATDMAAGNTSYLSYEDVDVTAKVTIVYEY